MNARHLVPFVLAGASTLASATVVNQAITELNRDLLHPKGLEIELSFDASVHIRRALALVNSNLLLGVVLSLLMLWYFLRKLKVSIKAFSDF